MELAGTLILDFTAPRMVKNKCLLFKSTKQTEKIIMCLTFEELSNWFPTVTASFYFPASKAKVFQLLCILTNLLFWICMVVDVNWCLSVVLFALELCQTSFYVFISHFWWNVCVSSLPGFFHYPFFNLTVYLFVVEVIMPNERN